MKNSFIKYAMERRNVESDRIMDREVGQLASLLYNEVTIYEVEQHISKETSEPFVVFTIEEDKEHFYFAPSVFKKDILFAISKGFNIAEIRGLKIMFKNKEFDDKLIYVYDVLN